MVAQCGTPNAARKAHSPPVPSSIGPPWFPYRLGACRSGSLSSLAGPCRSRFCSLRRRHSCPSAMAQAASPLCSSSSQAMPPISQPSPPQWTGHATFRWGLGRNCCWLTLPWCLSYWRPEITRLDLWGCLRQRLPMINFKPFLRARLCNHSVHKHVCL